MAIESPLGSASTLPDLHSPELFINRELSWLEFDMVASAFRAGKAFGSDRNKWVFGGLFGFTIVF